MRFFSTKNRPIHMGPYPTERLARMSGAPDLADCPDFAPLSFERTDAPQSIVNAMGEYQAMLDLIRDGDVNRTRAQCPRRITSRQRLVRVSFPKCSPRPS